MKTFDSYVKKVVRRHKSQTRTFNLPHGMWGNIEPMIGRIKSELWEESVNYKTREKEKQVIINAALKQIRTFYSKS